jgi:predicted nucleotidyltransferase
MSIPSDIKRQRSRIVEVSARHGARNPRLFGSAARGENGPTSDVDILVDMEAGRSLLDLVALERELSETLGCPVDVVVDGGISPFLRDRIYAEAVPL